MRSLPDKRVVEMRKSVFQKHSDNFDDICFTFFTCPSCRKEKIDLTLMPVVDKELLSKELLQSTQEEILEKIFDADFDFLHEKGKCSCSVGETLELRSVVYCYSNSENDFQNYIDYPFEEVKTFQVNLKGERKEKLFLFVDTETTGLPSNRNASYRDTSNWPRLVQIAWILADENMNVIKRKSFVIKPDFKIPSEAANFHRITTEKAITIGEPLRYVLDLLNDDISISSHIVAHNLKYDLNVIACEYHRLKLRPEVLEKKHICTMEGATDYCAISGPYGYNWPKLSQLHFKLFGCNFTEAHDASVDIEATYKCFCELINMGILRLN